MPITLLDAERERIMGALIAGGWVVGGPEGAAARLGREWSTLQKRMQELGIAPAARRAPPARVPGSRSGGSRAIRVARPAPARLASTPDARSASPFVTWVRGLPLRPFGVGTVIALPTRAERIARTPMTPAARWIPIIGALRGYNSARLRTDLVAGASVCVVMIPSVLAYAELAGLPPQHGLYAALAGMIGYALFASSRQVIAGPDAAITLLVASSLLGLAGVAAASGWPEEGARLLGAAEGRAASLGAPMFPRDQPIRRRCLDALTMAFSEEQLALALNAGRALPAERAIAEARTVAEAVRSAP